MSVQVDVVVVSFESRQRLREAVAPLARLPWARVVVVDNASRDGSLGSVGGLPIDRVALAENGGFARGCNVGWRRGDAPYVLLLNPDARIEAGSLSLLVRVLDADRRAGAVGPRIVSRSGSLEHSQRRFPCVRTTYARALFLHRLFPRASWSDDLIRDEQAYARVESPDWLSGACLLVRRSALEQLGGLDEGFFLYSEDIDLCRRLRSAGWQIRFEPEAVSRHEGGASAPRAQLLPVLAASRIRYATKHGTRTAALLQRMGIALGAVTHAFISRGGLAARRGHLRSVVVALRRPVGDRP